jgi:hypothetical protein
VSLARAARDMLTAAPGIRFVAMGSPLRSFAPYSSSSSFSVL